MAGSCVRLLLDSTIPCIAPWMADSLPKWPRLHRPADVDRAVSAASDAFYGEWKFASVEDRRALFIRFKEVLHSMADELATAKIQPQGGRAIPPLIDQIIDYYMGKLDDGVGELLQHGDQGTNYVYREPLGVVAIFASFNGPMMGALLAAVPALIAGNAVVLKTMQVFHEAGFPSGVVNALSGAGPEVGQALVAHPATRQTNSSECS